MTDDHPRPQLTRPAWRSLNGQWGYTLDRSNAGMRERWFADPARFTRQITVPFPPESTLSGIGEDPDSPMWYRREFVDQPQPGPRERVLVHFEGVDYESTVWVNGIHIGDHRGGQTCFTFDITDALTNGTNDLVLRAVDDRRALEQPRGKQDWRHEPHVIWYRRTSGIWRTVWLERVPETRIDSIRTNARPGLEQVDFEARLMGPLGDDTSLEIEIRHESQVLARTVVRCAGPLVTGCLTLNHASLLMQPEELWWTPESPTLLDLQCELTQAGHRLDSVDSYIGLRTIACDDRHFLLNDRPYFLRMVLEQAYWPDSHLSAPSRDALETEVKAIKALGFNGLRMHQASADQRLLSLCDKLGLVVLADIPAAYRFSSRSLEALARETVALVARDSGHPSLIGWVAFNESWGVPNLPFSPAQRHAVAAFYHLLKALDPERIALGNDGWEHVAGDFIGVHDYCQDGQVLAARYQSRPAVRDTLMNDRPGGHRLTLGQLPPAGAAVLLSEFGGINSHNDPDAWHGYGTVIEAGDLPGRLRQLMIGLDADSGLAGYCYTQLTDTEQEKNGLLTGEREPKAEIAEIRSVIEGHR
ncbi:MAG: hypothetical protein LBD77_10220 [Bifidobacteriaceae bacterium]|nr:hypothetical protein [Bifidobacteriaceae bacterium]